MSDLGNFTNLLEEKIKKGEVKEVKHPELLISSLKELDSIIGMQKLKTGVVLQLRTLLRMMKSGEEKDILLNTCLYGPPGTGKSTVALILAKIWYSLGYLEKKEQSKNNIMQDMNDPQLLYIYVLLFVMLLNVFVSMLRMIGAISKKVQYAFVAMIIFTIIYYYATNVKEDESNLAKNVAKGMAKDTDLITVTSRVGFVAEYLGQSGPKTLKLLRENSGKVIFVDEAYTMMTSPRDEYGKEALTEINRYMTENPSSCIIIFAGYREDIERLFGDDYQKGLASRFKWKLECEKYTPAELTKIFQRQCAKKHWLIEDINYIETNIGNNYDLFESSGRSVENLFYFSKLSATSTDDFLDLNKPQIIRRKDIDEGFKLFRESNKVSKDKQNNKNVNLQELARRVISEFE